METEAGQILAIMLVAMGVLFLLWAYGGDD
jgi:nitrogen fixation-related uncharacterized protein